MARRILVLNERDLEHPLAGGAEVHVFEIFRRLAERGDEITMLTASFPGAEPEKLLDGIRVRRLVNRYLYWGVVPFAARREARGGYDVVVDVLNKLPFLSPAYSPLPCFAIVHHLFGDTAFRQVSPPIALVTYLAEKLIPSVYRGVSMLAISPSTKDDLVARGLDPDPIHVVPPGIDHSVYSPADVDAAASDGTTAPIFAWIGRLEPYKRADVMIEALARVHRDRPDARLVIVGAGSARDSLEKLARETGVGEAVRFAGYVSEAEKIDILRRAHVVVQTSEKEGWGMTVIEGNACGTPCVASKVPGLRDAVRDGESGLLVPFGSVDALASALVRLLEDPALYERLSVGGLEWSARFAWDRVADDAGHLIDATIDPGRTLPELSASPFGG